MKKDLTFFISISFILGISCLIALIVALTTSVEHPASIIIFATAGGVGILAGTILLIISKTKYKNEE